MLHCDPKVPHLTRKKYTISSRISAKCPQLVPKLSEQSLQVLRTRGFDARPESNTSYLPDHSVDSQATATIHGCGGGIQCAPGIFRADRHPHQGSGMWSVRSAVLGTECFVSETRS
jgi:hypothetical protein